VAWALSHIIEVIGSIRIAQGDLVSGIDRTKGADYETQSDPVMDSYCTTAFDKSISLLYIKSRKKNGGKLK
jgi:hypothetical protein